MPFRRIEETDVTVTGFVTKAFIGGVFMDVEYIDEEYQPLISLFIETKEEELEILKNLCVLQDFERVAFMGHRMRGSAENYGFKQIAEMGRRLEFLAGSEDAAAIFQLLEELEHHLKMVQIHYIAV